MPLDKNEHMIIGAFMSGQGAKARGIAWSNKVCPTLKTTQSGGNTVPSIVYVIDQQGGKSNYGYAKDVMMMLCSDSHETQHALCYAIDALSSNSMKSKNPHSGFHATEISKTLDCHCDPTCNQGGW